VPRRHVVVVGSGILGLMHAIFAVRANCSVDLLERHRQPRGASVRNFGLCWVSGRAPGEELALALRARELWEQIGSDVPAVGFRANGSLTIATTSEEVRVLEGAVAREDASERGFELLDADGVRRVNPGLAGTCRAALHCHLDAAVEPRLVPAALHAFLNRSERYRYLPEREVVGIEDHAVVDHTGERHPGDLVVLCVGAVDGGAMGEVFAHAPLRRVRLQMAETAPLGRHLATSVADGNSLRYYPGFSELTHLLTEPRDATLERFGIQLLCQQRLDGSLTIGDTHEYAEPFAFDLADEPVAAIEHLARTVVGDPFPTIRRRWAGVYHQLTDEAGHALYERREVAAGVIAVTGAGGRGMTLAPAIAEESFR
jgi:FAD dependent oxidoreductase TIGR03364